MYLTAEFKDDIKPTHVTKHMTNSKGILSLNKNIFFMFDRDWL